MVTSQHIADLVLAADASGGMKAYLAAGFPEKMVAYQIEEEPVREVVTFPYHDFFLFRTDTKDYLRDANNEPVAESEQWTDFYFEPITNSLYRQDERGYWYDLEGFRLASPVFLKEEVLISLPGKTSKQSWAFAEQDLVSSPNMLLFQVGKMVFDQELKSVRFFGEKVTGLGRTHISFGGTDQWQEVFRGIKERAFINEFSGAPLLINDEEIIGHVAGVTRGTRHFEVFRSATREYALENSSEGEIRYEGLPLGVDLDTYLSLNGAEIVLADDGNRRFYFDLDERMPFLLPEAGKELIKHIDRATVLIDDSTLYNVRTAHREFVYDQQHQTVFTIDGISPAAVIDVPEFEEHYFYTIINGQQRLSNKATRSMLQLGREARQVANITGKRGAKLLNAVDIGGDPLVIDVRRGLRQPELAEIDGKGILRTVGAAYRIGDMVLQHIELDALGGAVSRVIDLQEPTLSIFTLPEDLTTYPDQPQPSCFAGNPIVQIDFGEVKMVQGVDFLQAVFLSDMGEESPVLLQHRNARPLHLDGAGHRNELVIRFKDRSAQRPYRIGEHLMIGAVTLSEDLVEGELMVSIKRSQSWLPFYDTFLPVFRRAVHIPELAAWDCILYEILAPAGAPGEYVAVEKNKPYRLLARKSRSKVEPKIITSKTKVLNDPEEMSALAKFFLSPGMLVEVS